MDKEDLVHVSNGIFLKHKKEWSDAIWGNTDGPRNYYTQWINSEIWYHLCGNLKKKDTKKWIWLGVNKTLLTKTTKEESWPWTLVIPWICLRLHYQVKGPQLCLPLCDPMKYTVHGILQARTLEWVAFSFSRGSSKPRNRTQVSRIVGGFLTSWATREAPRTIREA